MDDEELLYIQVKEWAMKQLYVSCELIKKEFGLKFTQSMRLFDRLIEDNIISPTRTDQFGNRVIHQNEEKADK